MKNILSLAFLAILLSSCKKDKSGPIHVEYSVTCTECNVEYNDINGSVFKKDTVKGSWYYSYYTESHDRNIYVIAQNLIGTNQVKATIHIDGSIVSQDVANCEYCKANVHYFIR